MKVHNTDPPNIEKFTINTDAVHNGINLIIAEAIALFNKTPPGTTLDFNAELDDEERNLCLEIFGWLSKEIN